MKLENATMRQKINYVRGRLISAGQGERLQMNRTGMFFDVVDADGTVLKTGTIDAVLYWLDNERKG